MRAGSRFPPSATLAFLLLAAAAVACGVAPETPEPASGEPAPFFDELPGDAAGTGSPGPAPSLAPTPAEPPSPPRVAWPQGFRLLESGAFGAGGETVSWYRLEGRGPSPRDAAEGLLVALEPLVGGGATRHVAGDGAAGAAGQAAGPIGRAGVRIRARDDVLTALVMLHPPTR